MSKESRLIKSVTHKIIPMGKEFVLPNSSNVNPLARIDGTYLSKFTAGSVLFVDNNKGLGEDNNNFLFDNITKELIINSVVVFGDLTFTGGGLPFGEVFVNDNNTVTSVSSAGFTQFSYFDTDGHNNNCTPDHTENHITIDKKGAYMVDCCVNIKNSSGNAHNIEAVVAKNNGSTIFPNMRRHRTLGTGTDIGAIPICGHISLEIGDTIELWITSDSASARDVTAEDVVLMVTQVGG